MNLKEKVAKAYQKDCLSLETLFPVTKFLYAACVNDTTFFLENKLFTA